MTEEAATPPVEQEPAAQEIPVVTSTAAPSVDTGALNPAPPDDTRGVDLDGMRRAMAGDDEKLLGELERYRTAEDLGKALSEAKKAARAKRAPLTLSDDATPEQAAEYREAAKIPEDVADYPISFSEDYKATDLDGEMLGSFKEMLHEKAGDPRTAGIAMQWYEQFTAQAQQDRDATMAKVSKETQTQLRADYGPEYDGNIEAANGLMKSQMGEAAYDNMLSLRFEDGTKLQDNPDFVKMMVNMGVDYYGTNGIVSGDVESTSKTIDEKIAALFEMKTSDPDKYWSEEIQGQQAALYAQKEKIKARK